MYIHTVIVVLEQLITIFTRKADYANLRDRKDDALIEKRKRMLLRFLTHLAAHPRLRHEHVFHQFLDGSVLWVSDTSYISLNGNI